MSAPARRMPVSVSSAHRLQVDPAVGRGGADHRVLTGDLICRHRHRRDVGGGTHQVEIGHRGLDHHDVGALVDVEFHLVHRFAGVARILLIGAPVAAQAGRHRLPERAVEARRELGGVGQDHHVGVPGRVQAVTDGRDLAVHHAAGPDDVGPRISLRHSQFHVAAVGGVIVHPAGGVEHPAVAVVGELVETGIGHQHGVLAEVLGQIAQRHVEDAVRGHARPTRVASLSSSRGTPNSISPPTPAATASAAARRSESRVCCTTPGIEAMARGSVDAVGDEHR